MSHTTEALSTSYAIFSTIAAGLVNLLAASVPGTEDAFAIFGAIFAGWISVVHSAKTSKSTLDLASVLVATAFCGSVAPGLLASVYLPDAAARLTWHGWAGAGFFCGLAGWSLVSWTINFFDKFNWVQVVRRFFGSDASGGKK